MLFCNLHTQSLGKCFWMGTLLGRRFHINKREAVTDAEGDDAEVRESGTTVAPSMVKEPCIVFTGMFGAAMMKMKQVCVCVPVCVCRMCMCVCG